MKHDKSFTLTKEQEAEVNKILEEGNKKYKDFSHILCESDIDASAFFEHDYDEELEKYKELLADAHDLATIVKEKEIWESEHHGPIIISKIGKTAEQFIKKCAKLWKI